LFEFSPVTGLSGDAFIWLAFRVMCVRVEQDWLKSRRKHVMTEPTPTTDTPIHTLWRWKAYAHQQADHHHEWAWCNQVRAARALAEGQDTTQCESEIARHLERAAYWRGQALALSSELGRRGAYCGQT
jgi:hypothetical protein